MKGEEPQPSEKVLARLLPESPKKFRSVSGGANNRVWEVRCPQGRYLLKEYYTEAEEGRDRFSSEQAFYRLAAERVPGQVARAVAWDTKGKAALFDWIDGDKLSSGKVEAEHVSQAMEFFETLNRNPLPDSPALPEAAESARSVQRHLEIIDQRVVRLTELSGSGPEVRQAADLVRTGISPAWGIIRKKLVNEWPSHGKGSLLCPACVSPSDFGFHNAVVRAGGRLCFFDFEYAGWDDPAKMLADFFSQPRISVPVKFFPVAVKRVADILSADPFLEERTRAMWPAYQLKWICIMLNEFLPQGENRRQFSLGVPVQKKLQQEKLAQARVALQRLEETLR
jgi:hypothetical protein